jgi:hypothetical protein
LKETRDWADVPVWTGWQDLGIKLIDLLESTS